MESLFPIEINFTLFFQALGDWLRTPFLMITSLGNEEFYILFMPLFYWCLSPIMGIRAGVMLIISGGIKDFLKVIIHTPRPYWVDSRVKAYSTETSFGMPSGHSQDAASIWGAIAVSQKRRWVTWIAMLLILLIGLSRIYLGVHFLHDVLAGWLVGGLILWGYLSIEKKLAVWISAKALPVQILLAFTLSVFLIGLGLLARVLVSGWQIPQEWITNALAASDVVPDPFNFEGVITLAAVAFGFLAGLAWWVKKYGFPKIETKGALLIVRYLLGMVGLAILYLGLKLILPAEPEFLGLALRFLRYSLVGFWVTAGAPMVFKKLKI